MDLSCRVPERNIGSLFLKPHRRRHSIAGWCQPRKPNSIAHVKPPRADTLLKQFPEFRLGRQEFAPQYFQATLLASSVKGEQSKAPRKNDLGQTKSFPHKEPYD